MSGEQTGVTDRDLIAASLTISSGVRKMALAGRASTRQAQPQPKPGASKSEINPFCGNYDPEYRNAHRSAGTSTEANRNGRAIGKTNWTGRTSESTKRVISRVLSEFYASSLRCLVIVQNSRV